MKVESKLLSLSGPFTTIARVMSRNWRVRIVPSGTECKTDGETIMIPFTADYLPESKRKILHGMLDHEVAHVAEERAHREEGLETPMDLMRKCKGKKTEMMLLNVFEDIRIETKKSKEYIGVGENLHASALHSVKQFRKKFGVDSDSKKADFNFWHTFGVCIIFKARGYNVDWAPPALVPYLDLVQEEIDESTKVEWVQGAKKLADSVLRKCREKAKEEKPEPGEGEKSEEESGGEESDESGTEGKKDKSDESSDGEPDKPEEEDKSGESGEGKAEGDPEEGESDDAGAGKGDEPEDPKETPKVDESGIPDKVLEDSEVESFGGVQREEMKKAVAKDALDNKRYIPNPAVVALDKWMDLDSFPSFIKPEIKVKIKGALCRDYDKARADVIKQIGAMKAKQLALIQTRSRKRIRGNLDDGLIDASALSQVRFGERRVYCDVTKSIELDTAIEVLIDNSGSMGPSDDAKRCSYWAKRTAIALAESWSGLGVANEFMGFTNDVKRHIRFTEHQPGTVSRFPFNYSLYKGFNEKLSKTKHRFAQITGYCDNADGEAVLCAARRLAVRREKRKILLVLSDGEPACGGQGSSRALMAENLNHSIKIVTNHGIEVLGVGMGTDDPGKYYNKKNGAEFVSFHQLDQMAANLFKKMREMLDANLRAS